MAGFVSGRRQRWWLVCGAALALLAPACTGGGDEAVEETTGGALTGATTTTEAAPTSVSPPSAFTAEPTPFSIDLAWAAPADEPEVERYTVYRDGSFVTSIVGTQLSYTDDGLSPGRRYSYEIESRAGDLISERVAAEATTPTPPLPTARLIGIFNVRTKEVSASGYLEHRAPTLGWRLRPRCDAGACNVRWNDLQRRRIQTLLRRRGARYQGTYTGFFNTLCSGARTTSSVTIDVKVTAARAIDGEWRATRLVGTLNQSEASQLGCVSSEAELSLHARLVRY